MTRRTYRQTKDGFVEVLREAKRGVVGAEAPMIQPDIEPYDSIITGEKITSRSQHREHLKMHGAEETGDNMPKFLRDAYERDGTKPQWGRDGRRVG